MGYYSDVRIVVSKEGWKVFEDFVGEAAEEMNEHNLLDGLSIWSTKEKEVYFGWNSIKFYDELSDVDIIHKGLRHLKELDYSYEFVRLGEEEGDYETDHYSSKTREKDNCLGTPYGERAFADTEYVTNAEDLVDVFSDKYRYMDPTILEKAAQKIREKREEKEKWKRTNG